MKKAVIFDFDGVICDSMKECFVTSNLAYKEYTHKKKRSSFQEFKRYRKYVAPPGEYYVLQLIMDRKETCKDYDQFRSLVRKYSIECKEFSKYFFEARNGLIEKDENVWLAMHSFYKEVIFFIRNYDFNFFIVTTKNDEAVQKLMRYAAIEDKICGIRSMKAGENKRDAVSQNIKAYNLDKVVFIDDHPIHAVDVAGLENVTTYLAAWGYWNGDASEFGKMRIPVLRLKDLSKTTLSF